MSGEGDTEQRADVVRGVESEEADGGTEGTRREAFAAIFKRPVRLKASAKTTRSRTFILPTMTALMMSW